MLSDETNASGPGSRAMAAQPMLHDWSVTKEKVEEVVRRIIETADPLQIIVFGSRARGDHREDSDLDLAVILDCPQGEAHQRLPYSVLSGVRMEVDMIVASKEKYDLYRFSRNSVFNYIAREGVVLHDREDSRAAHPDAVYSGAGGRVGAPASAA